MRICGVFGYNEKKCLRGVIMEEQNHLITDEGLVENKRAKRTRAFVWLCMAISAVLVFLGAGALLYH